MSKKDQAVQTEPKQKNRTAFEFVVLSEGGEDLFALTGITGKNYADALSTLKRDGSDGKYRIARLGPTITVKVQTVNKVVLS